MENVRPLFLQPVSLEIPLLRLRCLRLHRHLREVDQLSPHRHRWSQILFYFSGHGLQSFGKEAVHVSAGTAVWVPPGVEHAFLEETGLRPVCLVIDLDWRGPAANSPKTAMVPGTDIARLRGDLAALSKAPVADKTNLPPAAAARILNVLDPLLNALGLVESAAPVMSPAYLRKFDRILSDPEKSTRPLGDLAGELGYQRDALNRIFKSSTGVTLGQYRATRRAEQAIRLLRNARRVQEVSDALGFEDPNYFSRWFRKQTGRRPKDFLAKQPSQKESTSQKPAMSAQAETPASFLSR